MTDSMPEQNPVELLTADQIAARLAPDPISPDATPEHKYIRPLSDAAEQLMDWLVNDKNRFMFGLPQIDAMLRGVGRGELAYVTGKPHSGKTQLVLQAINNNPDKNILFFTPDELDVMVLSKLIAMNRSINVEDLENKLKAHDEAAIRMVREVAGTTFKNLFVVDQPLQFTQMTKALNEARELWGGNADVIFGDFLELFPGNGDQEGVVQLSQQFKAWLKTEQVAGVVLHQNSRTGGDRGKAAGMDGMRYGGESEAIYVLEVFRKRDGYDPTNPKEADEWGRHRTTVTVNVAKNKRPPSRTGEIDFHMNPDTGTILPLSAVPPRTPFNQPAADPTFDDQPF